MKKFFIFLPIIVFLAIGCNKPAVNPSPDATPPPAPAVAPPPPTSTDTKPRTGGVPNKIYTNTKYGYSTQYPNAWFVDTTNANADFTQRGLKEDSEFIGGDVSFSNYKDVGTFSVDTTPKDLYIVHLLVYKIDASTTYEKFAERYGTAGKREGVQVGGVNVMRISQTTDDHPVNQLVVTTLIKAGTSMYVFNYSGDPASKELQFAADSIINSFRLKTNSGGQ